MDETVRITTELALRRHAQQLDRGMLVARLQLRCEHAEGLDSRTLRDWEQRLHTPCAVYQQALCDYFGVDSIAELGLGTTLEAAHNWTWATKAERTCEVHRRQLLRLTVHATSASLLPVPTLTAAAQRLGGHRRLNRHDVDAAGQVATHLAASYATTPNQQLIRAAQAHAYTLLDLLKRASMTPQTRTRLTAVACDATSLAGYGHLYAGRYLQADTWFAAALRLAKDAHDRRLEALALASHAWTPLYGPGHDPATALSALQAAAQLQSFLPPAGRAWLLAHLARERAGFGDDLTSGQLLEQARAAAARIPDDDPGVGCWSTNGELAGWDGARTEVFTAIRSMRLGHPEEALRLFDTALDATTRPLRRAGVRNRMTEAAVALGDPDRACASAITALGEADTHGLGIIPDDLHHIRTTFPPQWSTLRPVIALDERLHTPTSRPRSSPTIF